VRGSGWFSDSLGLDGFNLLVFGMVRGAVMRLHVRFFLLLAYDAMGSTFFFFSVPQGGLSLPLAAKLEVF